MIARANFAGITKPGALAWSAVVPAAAAMMVPIRGNRLNLRVCWNLVWLGQPRSVMVIFALAFLGLAAPLFAQQPADEEGRSRFRAVDIYVDSKSAPLAAFQIEFSATNGIAKIVGIEGGDAAPFRHAPFYDPKAIQQERVIIAALSTESAAKLPVGKTRVATIHVQVVGPTEPQFEVKLQAAADPDGKKLSVEASFEERKAK